MRRPEVGGQHGMSLEEQIGVASERRSPESLGQGLACISTGLRGSPATAQLISDFPERIDALDPVSDKPDGPPTPGPPLVASHRNNSLTRPEADGSSFDAD